MLTKRRFLYIIQFRYCLKQGVFYLGGNAAYFQYDGFSQEQFQEIINQYVPPWLFTLLNITSILLTIIYLIAWWKMFTKAGEEGWKILIPFYGAYIQFRIIYGNGWKFLLFLVPVIRWFVLIMVPIRMAQVYGKSVGFGILNLLFPGICILFMAFGKCDYEGPVYSFL